MFLQGAYKFVVGYIEIQAEGYFVERFLNLCLNRKIEIWDVKRKYDGVIELKINNYDINNIYEIADNTKTNITIVKKNGIPHIASLYKKRKVFILICILALTSMYLASQRIWQIDITGNYSFPKSEIEKEIELENIRIGMLKKDIDFDSIKNEIYLRRKDILWLGLDISGVKLNVEVIERTDPDENYLHGKPCDIVSNKDGIITKIFVREGTKVKNVGDTVMKGDILVSRNNKIRLFRR